MIAFGPVTSRRLGKSLGINNIASQKKCSYSCVYCQIGHTKTKITQRIACFKPDLLVDAVLTHLKQLDKLHQPDYLTFVANGEPTLDIHLGQEIQLLKKETGIPIAVVTNASLLSQKEVRDELMLADWVSVKVDAIDQSIWETINRPSIHLDLDKIFKGIKTFASAYSGLLNTETMLIKDFNDSPSEINQIACFVKTLKPGTAYLSIPIRPPAVKEVKSVTEKTLAMAWEIFVEQGIKTELLNGFEGTDTGYTGNAFEDILNITAVHPLREDSIMELIKKEKAEISILYSLMSQGLIKGVEHDGKKYYMRSYHY